VCVCLGLCVYWLSRRAELANFFQHLATSLVLGRVERESERESARARDRERDRQTERARARETERQRDRQAGRGGRHHAASLVRGLTLYRVTSLIRNCHLLGPYSRPMPRVLGVAVGFGGEGVCGLSRKGAARGFTSIFTSNIKAFV